MGERTSFQIPDSPYSVIKQDELNWAVVELKVGEKGKSAGVVRESALSHHATLEQALNSVARRITDTGVHSDIESYIERLREVSQIVKGVAA